MSTLTVENVESPEQWSRAVKLRNAYNPDGPIPVERAVNYALAEKADVPKRRFLLTRDGIDLVYGSIIQYYWTPNPDLFGFHLMFGECEDGVDPGIDFSEATIRELGGAAGTCWYRTDRPVLGEALKRRGYEDGQRNPVACLELADFDPVPWLERRDAVLAEGYEIVDLASYAKARPESWKQDLWRIEMDLFKDVPLPDPWVEVPFEDWVRDLDANPTRFDWQFFALAESRPVAMTQLLPNWVEPALFHTGLTGVRREHRRRRLASAMKGHALALAREAGVRQVYTDNEENNPMFALNVALGFRQVYDTVNAKRRLT
ncbi:MAG TPA: GNAT family N-acetyltransferase [Fimbriimonadaceae bacterium]|nr:GNAT family N-acetyltransferase [Fimbriimonadaceae bacterium]HRJ95351.1 GNAT family N-acetyltransferase [Fimbriimonadaceae bacterium]